MKSGAAAPRPAAAHTATAPSDQTRGGAAMTAAATDYPPRDPMGAAAGAEPTLQRPISLPVDSWRHGAAAAIERFVAGFGIAGDDLGRLYELFADFHLADIYDGCLTDDCAEVAGWIVADIG